MLLLPLVSCLWKNEVSQQVQSNTCLQTSWRYQWAPQFPREFARIRTDYYPVRLRQRRARIKCADGMEVTLSVVLMKLDWARQVSQKGSLRIIDRHIQAIRCLYAYALRPLSHSQKMCKKLKRENWLRLTKKTAKFKVFPCSLWQANVCAARYRYSWTIVKAICIS